MGDDPRSTPPPQCSKSPCEQFIVTVKSIHFKTHLSALYLLGALLFLGGLPDLQIGPWSLGAWLASWSNFRCNRMMSCRRRRRFMSKFCKQLCSVHLKGWQRWVTRRISRSIEWIWDTMDRGHRYFLLSWRCNVTLSNLRGYIVSKATCTLVNVSDGWFEVSKKLPAPQSDPPWSINFNFVLAMSSDFYYHANLSHIFACRPYWF